uniref:Serine/threonine-protein phosphatase n=1 Tax=Panagrolaimus sp. PS1159 TaxID=55785 RepID=A0AC35FCT4_9BILA
MSPFPSATSSEDQQQVVMDSQEEQQQEVVMDSQGAGGDHLPPTIVKFRGKEFNVDKWLAQVSLCRYLPEDEMRTLCAILTAKISMYPNIAAVKSPATIVGDIHGQFYDLMLLFEKGGSPDDSTYVFMGDYVDRGYYSLESVTYLFLMVLKYPGKVILLRGNHETRRVSHQYGFYEDCHKKYCHNAIWKACCDVFDALPIAALIDDKIFCVHGGLSPSLPTLDSVMCLQRNIEVPPNGPLCDLVWSDPEESVSQWCMNPRGAGWVFGRDVAEQFVRKNNLTLICRSHQLVQEGFKYIFGNFLCNVWSAPNYCYRCGNVASILKIAPDGTRDVVIFSAVENDDRRIPERNAAPYFL